MDKFWPLTQPVCPTICHSYPDSQDLDVEPNKQDQKFWPQRFGNWRHGNIRPTRTRSEWSSYDEGFGGKNDAAGELESIELAVRLASTFEKGQSPHIESVEDGYCQGAQQGLDALPIDFARQQRVGQDLVGFD